MIQDFLSHGISIPIGSSNKFTKKLVKMLHQNCNRCGLVIPAWYINKFTIIDFTIYARLFLVKLKSIVDGPILHSKSVVDGSILHCKAKVCVFSKI